MSDQNRNSGKSLRGKRVMITGAAGGLGTQLAANFAEAGCDLVLTDINANALELLSERLKKYPVSLQLRQVDATDKAAVESFISSLINEGGVDILINNAGIGFQAELPETTIETWRKLFDVNFWNPVYHTNAILPWMIQNRRGHIVNICSGQAFFRMPTWGAYSVTKLALGGFSEILSVELEKHNIRVTTVYPFLINTGFYDSIESETLSAKMAMMMMPLYSQKPETVARIIFEAVRDSRPIEMVNPLNDLAKFLRWFQPLGSIVDKTLIRVLGKDTETDRKFLRQITESANGVISSASEKLPEVGFEMVELMTGDHHFTDDRATQGQLPFSFRVIWGPRNLINWMNAADPEGFMKNDLKGTITVGGLCEETPVEGFLQLRYFQDQKIRYDFHFQTGGRRYHYVGEKVNIFPWNLPYSHTTCFGKITDEETGQVISESVTHFELETTPEFLGSFRLTGAAQ